MLAFDQLGFEPVERIERRLGRPQMVVVERHLHLPPAREVDIDVLQREVVHPHRLRHHRGRQSARFTPSASWVFVNTPTRSPSIRGRIVRPASR